MNDELKKAVRKSQSAAQPAHPKERVAFKSLILANPNYFGNLTESPFTPVLGISQNTHYEELACIGYQPQQQRLEAVVYIFQPSGYGTDVCGPGTQEYVRFYLSLDNGSTWQDQGITSFQAYNIPEGTDGGKRLEYAVSLPIAPKKRPCSAEQLILVRAILSWNDPPPVNQPAWAPVWGNVRDAVIQVEPRRHFLIAEVFELAKVNVPPLLKEMVGEETEIHVAPQVYGGAELAALYKGKGVPAHRFAYKELKAFTTGQFALSAEAVAGLLPGVALEPGVVELLHPKGDGDTSYEELTCIGLDPNAPDTLVGIIRLKKSLGYSGGLCTRGSVEYVTFWADFDADGSFETCLGTASVAVYDLAHIPSGGVHYAVRLPVDFSHHRQACKAGAKVVPIRAILSWNGAVPCADPNHVPTWGNREETLIHIAPSEHAPAGKIAILGGIATSQIDGTTGLTTPGAVFATNNTPPDALGRPCPFAARVSVQGAPLVGFSYIVEVSPDNLIWSPVLTDLTVTDQLGNVGQNKANPITKRFDYLPFTSNVNGLLAEWDSAGDALWSVRLSVFDGAGVLQSTDVHVVQLDNTWPTALIDILTGAGDCGKFPIGTVLTGKFLAEDANFGSYSITVEPAVNPAGVGVPVPNSGFANTAISPGDDWTLDTSGMRACGYVIRLVAVDRAIVSSQSVGHYQSSSAGFCLIVASEG